MTVFTIKVAVMTWEALCRKEAAEVDRIGRPIGLAYFRRYWRRIHVTGLIPRFIGAR
jgi:hypothetical protein